MIKYCLPVFITLSVFSAVACYQQETDWLGSTEEVNGVTVVSNPKDPIYGEDVFTLEEELSIGEAEGQEEYMFTRISAIAVDNKENIYVADRESAHIRVFDRNGDYVRTIGRKGQGPGEMLMPVYIQVTVLGEILVHDLMAQRLSYFSMDGKFLRQNSTAEARSLFVPVHMDAFGNLIVTAGFAPPPVGGKKLKMYNSNLELLKTIAEEERGQRGVFDVGKPTWCCDVSPSDTIIWGDSKEYVLHILNQKGELVKKITKEHDPIAITAEDKERSRDRYAEPLKRGLKIHFRSHFPAFSEISVDDEGRIFAKTFERVEEREDIFYYDVFDREGKYIAKIPLKMVLDRNSVWKKHKLYCIEEEEEGYQLVKKYNVTWNY